MAIVLPQGNLNNLGTRGLRAYVSDRARLLAAVGLHINTFKPFTNTKTSVLFLQKWGGDAGEPVKNYPVFMATSQRSGKDNGGEYIYRTVDGHIVDEDGTPSTQSGKSPAIDHDLDEIADAFVNWGKEQCFSFLED